MPNLSTVRAFGPRALLLTVVSSVGLLSIPVETAKADKPEYWTREHFESERSPTYTASLSSDESDQGSSEGQHSRRRAPVVTAALVDDDDEESQVRHHKRRKPSQAPKIVERDERPAARRQARKQRKAVRVASLGPAHVPSPKPERSIAGGGGVRWVASSGCLNGSLRGVISQVAQRFGSVTVNSTCRSRRHNARVGGAGRSLHLTGNAADFRVHGNWGAASAFIRSLVGGFKHYGGGLFHIDNGTRRSW
jgi:hypothetical protein